MGCLDSEAQLRYKEKVSMDQFLSGTNDSYVNISDETKKIGKESYINSYINENNYQQSLQYSSNLRGIREAYRRFHVSPKSTSRKPTRSGDGPFIPDNR